jgi:hypothetical protein
MNIIVPFSTTSGFLSSGIGGSSSLVGLPSCSGIDEGKSEATFKPFSTMGIESKKDDLVLDGVIGAVSEVLEEARVRGGVSKSETEVALAM